MYLQRPSLPDVLDGPETNLAVDFVIIADRAGGGQNHQAGGLTVYFSSEQGLRIITGKDEGLTYAQVSDMKIAESCAIVRERPGNGRNSRDLRNACSLPMGAEFYEQVHNKSCARNSAFPAMNTQDARIVTRLK